MKHLIVKIKSVTVPELYKIKVIFDDATEKIIDLVHLLSGPMYSPLKDPEIFKAHPFSFGKFYESVGAV